MAKKDFGAPPFPPLVRIETDQPLAIERLAEILGARPNGVTVCVRSAQGHANRGGYFFHLKPTNEELDGCEIYNFEQKLVGTLPLDRLTDFVNHCTGLAFDEWAYQFCQSTVNFSLDPE